MQAYPGVPEGELQAVLDGLNLQARRPSPFNALSQMRLAWESDEFAPREREIHFLVAFEGAAPIGYLPLRRSRELVLGRPRWKTEFLATHDADRPTVVCRPQDEARCAEAFLRFLLDEPGWTFLELNEQDARSPLAAAAERLELLHHYLRSFENAPNSTIPLPYASLAEYFRAVPKKHRDNIARLGRRLLRAGPPAFVTSSDPRALPPLFELYLELERHSWKARAHGTVARDPRRVAYYRDLLAGRGALGMSLNFLLLDGLPVAGMLNGRFGDGLYGMELIFAEAYNELAPGRMMMLLSVRDAIARGCRFFNLLGSYAYFKSRWMATITETRSVQLYRVGSLHFYRALLGELRRKVRPAAPGEMQLQANLAKRQSPPESDGAASCDMASCECLRDAARGVFGALERAGATVQRLEGGALLSELPFATPGTPLAASPAEP